MQKIRIDSFAGGVLKEKFEEELTKVLENIADPNTKEETVRKISLDIKFKPDSDREIAQVEINSKSALAGTKSVGTMIMIGRDLEKNKVFASEFGKSQIKGQMNIKDFQNSENTEDKIEEEKNNETSQVVDFRTKSN